MAIIVYIILAENPIKNSYKTITIQFFYQLFPSERRVSCGRTNLRSLRDDRDVSCHFLNHIARHLFRRQKSDIDIFIRIGKSNVCLSLLDNANAYTSVDFNRLNYLRVLSIYIDLSRSFVSGDNNPFTCRVGKNCLVVIVRSNSILTFPSVM